MSHSHFKHTHTHDCDHSHQHQHHQQYDHDHNHNHADNSNSPLRFDGNDTSQKIVEGNGQDSKDYVFTVNDLFNSIRYGTWDHIVFIVERDKSLVQKLDSEGHTCIHWAAKRGDYEILKYLHSAGAALDIASTGDPRMMPIHWAASDGKIKSLKFFLDSRVDINALDGNGCTPVVTATQYNQVNAVAFFIKSGADMTLRDNNGDSALHWAAYKGYEELCGLLIHCMPQELDFADTFGQTPLHLATLRGHHDVVQYLIADHGADYSKRDKNGLNPLELSMKKNQLKAEWVIRRLSARSFFHLCTNLGLKRLKNNRILCFLLVGANELDMAKWIWRVAFLSNFTASSINLFYAAAEQMADLYVLHLANTIINFIWWILFFAILWKDPGFPLDASRTSNFKSGSAPPNSYAQALDVIGSGDYADFMEPHPSLPSVCHTCRIVKPLRSKHCKVARRCVLKFDHFCPYVYNTIGRDNYKFFYGLLCCHQLAFSLFFISTFVYTMRVSISYWFIAFLIYSFLMALLVMGLFMYHSKLIAKNLTTNEDVNMDRYTYMKNERNTQDNPFNKGSAWANFLDSIFPSEKLYYKREEVLRDNRFPRNSYKKDEKSSASTSVSEEEGFLK
eukprot:gene24633-33102_t